jgi:hypothetical protein
MNACDRAALTSNHPKKEENPMPIEIVATQGVVGSQDLVQFSFKNPVTAYAIGIMAFTATYYTTDHWIQSLMIKILPGQNVAATSNQVTAQVRVAMQDDSGNTGDADSIIWPVCIAVTGSPQYNTVVGSAIGISSGTSQEVSLPSLQSGYSIATCFQSGFNLSFTKDDHQVLQANAGCGLTYAGQSGQISASANLRDKIGNQVQVATVDAGYIVSSSPTPGMGVVEVRNVEGDPLSPIVHMTTMPSVGSAAVFIRSWNVQFDSVSNVQTISVGAWQGLEISGNRVTIPVLCAQMNDASGNTQDNSSSYCDALVIAVP